MVLRMTKAKLESRMDAALGGRKRYLSDRCCDRCASRERYTSNGSCVQCCSEAARRHREKIRDALKSAQEAG